MNHRDRATRPSDPPGVPSWKLLPPPPPAGYIERPRVKELLSRGHITAVVAGPGFGKTVAVSELTRRMNTAWYAAGPEDTSLTTLARGIVAAVRVVLPALPADVHPGAEPTGPEQAAPGEAFASWLCQSLDELLGHDLTLIVDDLHEINAETPSARLLDALCRHAPPRLRVVLASRRVLPFPLERMRGRGRVVDVDAQQLALSLEELAELLGALNVAEEGLAHRLHEVTGGWPAVVKLIAETLRRGSSDILADPALATRRDANLHAYLAEEVFNAEPKPARDLLRTVSVLGRFSVSLCEALGINEARQILDDLTRRGLFVEMESGTGGWFRVSGLMRRFILDRFPLEQDEARDVHGRAAEWFAADGHLGEALHSLRESGRTEELSRFLVDEGAALFDSGLGRELVAAAESLPGAARTPEIDLWAGQAKQAQGDFEGALECFRRAGGDGDELPAALAWRIGHIHYMRGEPDRAMEAYARGRIDAADTADEALLLAWTATLHWVHGDTQASRAAAESAHRAALASGDQRALAAAHTTLAMLAYVDGDRRGNDAHYLQALDAAERAGDLYQVVRIRTNRASLLYEEGWFEPARAELDLAIRTGELNGFTTLLPMAILNRGWTSYHQGRLEEAMTEFERSRLMYQRFDSRHVAYSLEGRGAVYLARGDLALARVNYEEAVKQAEEAHDMQELVSSLAGLARVIAADDIAAARELSERALGLGTTMGYVEALLSGGWIALAGDDHAGAVKLAEEAVAAARERRDRIGLAEALELLALSGTPGTTALGRLKEARTIWAELGSPIGVARVDLALSSLSPKPEERAAAGEADRRLRSLGVRPSGAAGALTALPRAAQPAVGIRSLGGFQVVRDGCPVPAAEWQSRKSRDLLKILVARRGGAIHREQIADALWPDEDPTKMGSRISVALSRIRAALDPEHRFDAEYFVSTAEDAVTLAVKRLDIDVERFMRLADKGLALLREGNGTEAVPLLQAAESAYAGDFLEEDAYAEWALPLREQARARYIVVARGLAEAASAAGDHDTAVRCYLRALERDPYDEEAHLGLASATAAAGHHGESRRYYRSYVAKMDEIGVEAAPFPAPKEFRKAGG